MKTTLKTPKTIKELLCFSDGLMENTRKIHDSNVGFIQNIAIIGDYISKLENTLNFIKSSKGTSKDVKKVITETLKLGKL